MQMTRFYCIKHKCSVGSSELALANTRRRRQRKTFHRWHSCQRALDMFKPISNKPLLIYHPLILPLNTPECAHIFYFFFPSFTVHPSQHSHTCYTFFTSTFFLIGQHFDPRVISLSNCLSCEIFTSIFVGRHRSQRPPKASLYFNHAALIQCSTSSSTSPSEIIIEPAEGITLVSLDPQFSQELYLFAHIH